MSEQLQSGRWLLKKQLTLALEALEGVVKKKEV
jgi:hypothetical protein